MFCFLVLLFSCTNGKNKKQENSQLSVESSNLLIIYCENSLAPMFLEMEKEFEKKHNCDVRIVNDCAVNLVELIEYSHRGDLFIPDALSTFALLNNYTSVDIVDSVFIGYNQIVLLVPRGNPKGIHSELSTLVNKDFSVAIANPEASTLGLETRKIIDGTGSYSNFARNVVAMTVDVKGLDKFVASNEVDYAITWTSGSLARNESAGVDRLSLIPDVEVPVYLGMMSTSKNPIYAKYFMDFVSSGEQMGIILKNGLKRRRSQIF
ncbi:MAG: substrate-binding domain-containing protein [Breznakibacter sp.]